jgi:chromosome segregation ATPase
VIVKNDLLKKRLEESQAKIRDLESKLEASQTMSECIQKDHSTIYGKFIFAREEADRLTTKLSDAIDELVACCSKVETLSQSILAMKTKFRKAKENCANME